MARAVGASMRLVVLALLAIGAFDIGCSEAEAPAAFSASRPSRAADESDAREDEESSGRAERPPSRVPTDTSGTKPTPPAPAVPTAWSGRLETSPMVDFGGGKWCNYHVVLSNIELHVTLDADGHIASTDLTNTMTETATACEAQPLGVQQNMYAFRKAANGAPSALTVMQTPDPNNLPQADVTLVADIRDASHMRARLLFHRTGAVEDVLNWRDTLDVDLTPDDAGPSPSLSNDR